MTELTADNDTVETDDTTTTDDHSRTTWGRRIGIAGLVGLGVVSLVGDPVAAAGLTEGATLASAQPDICGQTGMETITTIIGGWIELTAALGIMLLVAVWQADALAELVTSTEEGKKRIKRHKRTAAKSGATLLVIGPIATVGGAVMEIPFFQCVDLIPF